MAREHDAGKPGVSRSLRARVDTLLHPAETEDNAHYIPPPVFQPSTVMLGTFVVAIIAGVITLIFPGAQ